jgi:hypothetical protein
MSISPTIFSAPTNGTTYTQLLNGNFENWDKNLPDSWELDLGSQLNKTTLVHSGKNAAEFVEDHPNSVLISDSISASLSGSYDIDLWYQTESTCANCGFIAFKFLDSKNQIVNDDTNGCGVYNGILQSWVYYLPGDATSYKEYKNRCIVPTGTKSFVVKIGLWSVSDQRWRFDDISVKPSQTKN